MSDIGDYFAIDNIGEIAFAVGGGHFEFLQEYHALHDYVIDRYVENRVNFLIIDEVQMCKGFERVINSLHNTQKFDIYITGSNAFLLSSDLATLFAGRVLTIEVMPFSFKKYRKYYGEKTDKYEDFERYLREGGFAGSYRYDDIEEKYRYLNEIYNTMVLRDIEKKYDVQDVTLLNGLSDFLMSNISRLTTGRTLANTLTSNGISTNNKTVGVYLDYFCNYPRIIIARTRQPEWQYEGIRVIDIADWLTG